MCGFFALAVLVAPAGGVAAVDASAANPVSQQARSLKAKGGFFVKAPAGFKARRRGKKYVVSNGKIAMDWTRSKNKQSASTAGAEVVQALSGAISSQRGGSKRYSASFTVAGKLRGIDVRRKGKYLQVAVFRDGGLKGSASMLGRTAAGELTAADIARLARIAGSARGGTPLRFAGAIPLKPFTASDGSATAFVPDRPGWTFGGASGAVEGSNPKEGTFAFGILVPFQYPGIPFPSPNLPTAPYPAAAQAFAQALPMWFAACCATTVTGMQVLGSASPGSLGPGYDSALFSVRFQLAGKTWISLWNLGTHPGYGDGLWYLYYSMAAIPENGDPRIGAALIDTWASWNPGADQTRRINQAVQSVLTTRFGGGPIDQDVFDAAAQKWSAYIRQ